jgi:hypothetical protein
MELPEDYLAALTKKIDSTNVVVIAELPQSILHG